MGYTSQGCCGLHEAVYMKYTEQWLEHGKHLLNSACIKTRDCNWHKKQRERVSCWYVAEVG